MKIILIADTHLRESIPECRVDEYHKVQALKMEFLCVFQKEIQATYVLDAGDIFNQWKSSPFVEAFAIRKLPKNIITIPGNHELPNHNLNLLHKSSLSVLEAARVIKILQKDGYFRINNNIMIYGYPWGTKVGMIRGSEGMMNVAIIHDMLYKDRNLWPGARVTKAKRFLQNHPQFDLVVSGHNHTPFEEEFQGRILVNPGSMMRMFADQGDMKPGFCIWDTEKHEIERVHYPIARGVVSREHIERKKERDDRLDSFVRRMKDDYEVGLSFEKNLERYFRTNKERPPVEQLVWEALE